MITEERIRQIRKRLKRGEPEGELKSELRREGYTEADMAKIFVAHKPDMQSWYLFFGIIFFIAGVWIFSLLLIAASAILFSLYYVEWQKARKENRCKILFDWRCCIRCLYHSFFYRLFCN